MGWIGEHGPDYEVPGLIDFMVGLDILKDMSWHNDAAPSFGVDDPEREGRGVRLWVDHPVLSQREVGGKRFIVQDGEWAGESDWEMDTDDLEEAVTALLRRAEKYQPRDRRPHFDHVVEAWKKSLVQG